MNVFCVCIKWEYCILIQSVLDNSWIEFLVYTYSVVYVGSYWILNYRNKRKLSFLIFKNKVKNFQKDSAPNKPYSCNFIYISILEGSIKNLIYNKVAYVKRDILYIIMQYDVVMNVFLEYKHSHIWKIANRYISCFINALFTKLGLYVGIYYEK